VLYLGWIEGDDLTEVPDGPWEDGFVLRPGLVLLRSDGTRSEVYHHLKWSQPEGRSILLAPLAEAPKAKGMAPGLKAWLQAATSEASTSAR
jgi:hypothetical protein